MRPFLCSSHVPLLVPAARPGRNPFDGYTPKVPHGKSLDFASPEFLTLESSGLVEAGRAAFVLVAGGLGERLGYSGERETPDGVTLQGGDRLKACLPVINPYPRPPP